MTFFLADDYEGDGDDVDVDVNVVDDDDEGDNGLVLLPASEQEDQRPLAPHNWVVHTSNSSSPLPPGCR